MADYGGAISLSQGLDLSHTSDDESSEHSPRSMPTLSTPTPPNPGSSSSSKPKKKSTTTLCVTEFGSTPEVSKKPRGRPAGSKNKPKPPIVITKNSDSAMKPVILEISAGNDVVETLIQFARKRHVGISVLSGSGSVSNVTLRHPAVSHAPSLSLHGPFNLLSLSGSFLGYSTTSSTKPPSSSSSSSPSSFVSISSFGICLAGAQGQVFGGIVGGKVIAESLVVVMAATYTNPAFHSLPSDDTDEAHHEEVKPNIGSGGGGGGGGGGNANARETCTTNSTNAMSMSIYSTVGSPSPTPLNCIAPDVMPWGPTSRPPY
ncbi:AT-hook motif nuclear-localized protein 28-like [Quercus robur]|uniref:AT-hook motif nuclear-localized protein 28-like n=1 Tax=Quercus robur TaxID=38942 RepID=UPI002163FF5A|nr:AT-hook motif nuclear-localized protein 28-like [Quercus robur]